MLSRWCVFGAGNYVPAGHAERLAVKVGATARLVAGRDRFLDTDGGSGPEGFVLDRSDGCVVIVAAAAISGSVFHIVALVCMSSTLPL